ncbi:hypothetical protein A2U01_0115278, partial [Trifolium medium]|nr:hypothetical protein [Trifolium medium]
RDKTENFQVPGKEQRATSLSELLSRLAIIHHSRLATSRPDLRFSLEFGPSHAQIHPKQLISP